MPETTEEGALLQFTWAPALLQVPEGRLYPGHVGVSQRFYMAASDLLNWI